jgi:hypothetical protein
LNGSAPILIGAEDSADRLDIFNNIINSSPNGGTPLCRHIREVIERIRPMEQSLRLARQKVCLVIATDGESSDGDIATAMQPLKNLPVWVVVRLCTDDAKIVDYWNNIDKVLELDMDVLDDLFGEAEEVFESNSWLTYAEPLHRLREFGFLEKELDLLDEDLLSLEQIRMVCEFM